VKVRAPFHVGVTFALGWELFSFRAMVEWFGDPKWDYYFTQRLASQGEQLALRHNFEVWRSRRSARVRRAVR